MVMATPPLWQPWPQDSIPEKESDCRHEIKKMLTRGRWSWMEDSDKGIWMTMASGRKLIGVAWPRTTKWWRHMKMMVGGEECDCYPKISRPSEVRRASGREDLDISIATKASGGCAADIHHAASIEAASFLLLWVVVALATASWSPKPQVVRWWSYSRYAAWWWSRQPSVAPPDGQYSRQGWRWSRQTSTAPPWLP